MMKYTVTTLGGVEVVQRERDDGVIDYIAKDESNPDYQEYLATLAPEPTLEEEIVQLEALLAEKKKELIRQQILQNCIAARDRQMANGQLTDATILVIAGIIGLFVIAGIVLGVFVQIKKLRTDAKAETDAKVKKATEEAMKEKESEIAFRELKASVDNVNTTVK